MADFLRANLVWGLRFIVLEVTEVLSDLCDVDDLFDSFLCVSTSTLLCLLAVSSVLGVYTGVSDFLRVCLEFLLSFSFT